MIPAIFVPQERERPLRSEDIQAMIARECRDLRDALEISKALQGLPEGNTKLWLISLLSVREQTLREAIKRHAKAAAKASA